MTWVYNSLVPRPPVFFNVTKSGSLGTRSRLGIRCMHYLISVIVEVELEREGMLVAARNDSSR